MHPRLHALICDSYAYHGYDYVITVAAAYTYGATQHQPVATLRIDNIIYDSLICGILCQRWSWLPSWMPFNHYWNCGIDAQVEMLERLHQRAQRICRRTLQLDTER